MNEISRKFSEGAIVSFMKESEEISLPARGPEEQRLSVQGLGKKILKKNLEEYNLDPKFFENMFELLLEKKTEKAMELLEKQFTQSPPRA